MSAEHGATLKSYVLVFAALIALTVVTVLASYAEFPASIGFLHTPVAFAIAGLKATLVLLFFMHLWKSPKLYWLVAFGSLLWLAIMIVLTWADYATRARLVP